MSTGPMEPERLARLRTQASLIQSPMTELIGELLADRDLHVLRAKAAEATAEYTDRQFCRTLDALDAREYGEDETLPSSARSIIDEVKRLRQENTDLSCEVDGNPTEWGE